MNCKKCGTPFKPGEKFCSECGEKLEVMEPVVEQPEPVIKQNVVEPIVPVVPVVPEPVPEPVKPVEPVEPVKPVEPVTPAPTPVEPEAKPVKKGVNPILCVLLAIVAFVIGFFGFKFLNGEGIDILSSNTDVSFGGYTFTVPKSMKTSLGTTEDKSPYIEMSDSKYSVTFSIYESDSEFDSLKPKTTETNTYIAKRDYKGNSYYLFDRLSDQKKSSAIIGKFDKTKIVLAYITVGNGSTSPSTEDVENALKIIYSGIKDENAKTNTKIFNNIESEFFEKEEAIAGDVAEDVYSEIYVNISLDEINE